MVGRYGTRVLQDQQVESTVNIQCTITSTSHLHTVAYARGLPPLQSRDPRITVCGYGVSEQFHG
jgi:hypothetical protein